MGRRAKASASTYQRRSRQNGSKGKERKVITLTASQALVGIIVALIGAGSSVYSTFIKDRPDRGREKFVAEAGTICQIESRYESDIVLQPADTGEEFLANLHNAMPTMRRLNSTFHEIAPPHDVATAWKKVLDRNDQRIHLFEEVDAIFESGDVEQAYNHLDEIDDSVNMLTLQNLKWYNSYDIPECGSKKWDQRRREDEEKAKESAP